MTGLGVRGRISDGTNRARLKLEFTRALRPLGVIAIGAASALAIVTLIVLNIASTLLADTYTARFAVDDASAVTPGAQEVRMKGIPAGRITGVEKMPDGAVVTVEIKKQYGKVYRDAHAVLRPNTALQDMFLDVVDRGTSPAGELHGTTPLPAAQTDVAVNVADVLNTFRADTRTSLNRMLDNLGNGLDDRGLQLRQAFAELVPLLQAAGGVTEQLARRKELTRSLVHDTAALTGALADTDVQLRQLVSDGSVALSALQDSSTDLDHTLAELPPTMQQIGTTFADVRGVLGDVDGAVRSLYPVGEQVPDALRNLRLLNDALGPAVDALQQPVDDLVPLSRALVPVSDDLADAASALLPQTDTVDMVTRRLVGCEKGVQGFFQWDASLTKFGDVRGAVPRGNFAAGAQSTGILTDPSEFAPDSCTPGGPIGGRPAEPGDEH